MTSAASGINPMKELAARLAATLKRFDIRLPE